MIITPQKLLAVAAVCLLTIVNSTTIFAAEPRKASKPLLDSSKFSIGAGISLNSVNGPVDDETGFQFFAAYDLTQLNVMQGIDSSIEFGYMDYGFDGRDSDGLWANVVVDGSLSGKLGWLARLGLDFGDDSGLMFGAGFGYAANSRTDVRLEYVVRDDVDSLQFNVLFGL